jgi:hypothetical protein
MRCMETRPAHGRDRVILRELLHCTAGVRKRPSMGLSAVPSRRSSKRKARQFLSDDFNEGAVLDLPHERR